jgi:hypothetical protein
MSARRLAFVAFLIYLGVDLANPLVPGAVRFVSGAVESVEADRARDAEPAVPRPDALPAREVRAPDRAPSALSFRPAPPGSRPGPALHRVIVPAAEPSPAAGDDH